MKKNLLYRFVILFLFLFGFMAVGATNALAADPFKEVNGQIVIEAENYHTKANTTPRDWYIFPRASSPTPDPDPPHTAGTGNGKYVELLPDTRVTHADPLVNGVNFWSTGSGAPRMNYRVVISSAGRYYIRARANITGTEDNSVHFGFNNQWPTSGNSLQWCGSWGQWVWSGARRTSDQHCGVHNAAYLDLPAGEHTIMVAGREDGFELDRFILTKSSSYFPTGIGPAESPRTTGGAPATNSAPVVNAGPDQTIKLSGTATLNGSATDDGIPGGALAIQWRMVSGPGIANIANTSRLQTSVTFNALGNYVLELSAHDGELQGTDRIGISVVAETSPGTPSEPDNTDTGLIVIDAVNHAANISRGGHSWVPVNQGGVQAMHAAPDTGVRIASNYVSSSPYVRFNVNFQKTGTYYVWLRGFCAGNDNSAHVGLNGQAVAAGANLTLPVRNAWVWSGTTAAGQRVAVSVNKTGAQTIEVYMREDGLKLGKILLTTSSSYTPSGAVDSTTGGGSTPPPGGTTGGSFVQDTGSNGLVVMMAENHATNVGRGKHSWVPISHNGVDAMEAFPDSGVRIASNYVSSSPYMRFNVNFQKTGTHYIWLRGFCRGNDNSAHIGMNGQAFAAGANLTLPVRNAWIWSGTTAAGQRVAVSVNKTGLQTIEIYMREDGLIIDKVLVTTSVGYTPAGSGPAESIRK